MDFTEFLYGGDYNPEQWLGEPEILEKDIEMMKKAHVNTVTLGVFSWSFLEPEEGRYEFDWLEKIVNRLYENGISTILATPSGARPHWLADKYPEVLRVNEKREKMIFGGRHNHCFTSPVYREKTAAIDAALAGRFDANPAVRLWHVSNEYGGDCHCPRCQEAFRAFLKEKYGTIDALNKAWNSAFWSHIYDSFDQVESPSSLGEESIMGLVLDWKRFVTYETRDFMRNEIRALRDAGAVKPCTINMMQHFKDLDYRKFAADLDIISWDNYPSWLETTPADEGFRAGMQHDMMRSMKKAPFLMMESTPSMTNWQDVSRIMKPGMLFMQSFQAVAHGSESVFYFQWRASLGGDEKFHGAVVDHTGSDQTRVFREASEVGSGLEEIKELAGTQVVSRTAVIYDMENEWAIAASRGPRNQGMHYEETVLKSYKALRSMGLNVDVLDEDASLDGYKLVSAPMLYMLKEGFADKIRAFVQNGGIFISTYHTGLADENDKCFAGTVPNGLTDVFGIERTEIDALNDWEENKVSSLTSDLPGRYTCTELCELVRTCGAEVLAVYGSDFYKGMPVLTRNRFGKGWAYYLAANVDDEFYYDLFDKITRTVGGIRKIKLPAGLSVMTRTGADADYLIFQNFTGEETYLPVDYNKLDVVYGGASPLTPYGAMVLRVPFSRPKKGGFPNLS
ncbi:MAG TPA: beta-galactosidase [Lachnospiraceae bacterium]|nr:beta-galactosidase [Lachnospiraceae bacterium]